MNIPTDISTEETRLLADMLRRFPAVEKSIEAAEAGEEPGPAPQSAPHSPIKRAAIAFDAACDIEADPADRRRNLEVARRLLMERAEKMTP